MTKKEFAKKWGFHPAKGFGIALFDCRKDLLIDLDKVIEVSINEVLPIHDEIIYAARRYESNQNKDNLPHHDFINGARFIISEIIKNKGEKKCKT